MSHHRLLHSLVFSSVMALDATGCTTSHEPQDMPPRPDADGLTSDGGLPPVLSDGGVPPVLTDAFVPPEPSRDASVPPDAFMPTDDRFCEEGWPTTKATSCTEVEGMSFLRCCNLIRPDGGEDCCLLEQPGAGA